MRLRLTFARVSLATQSWMLAVMLAGAGAVFVLLHFWVIQAPTIRQDSMAPTLKSGERHILWMLPYRFRDPRRGEIVAVRIPGDDSLIVKRIIALPMESIEIRDGRVYVDNRPLDERYLHETVNTAPGRLVNHRYQVAPDCYFVLGDNRPSSIDSRDFGAIQRTWIVGTLN